MKAVVCSLVAVAAIAASTGDARSGAAPATVAGFPGIVRAFSENSGRIAWIDSAWILRVRGLRGGTVHSIRYTSFYQEIPDLSGQRRLIAEGRRLLWISTRGTAMFIDADHVYAADVAAKQQPVTSRSRRSPPTSSQAAHPSRPAASRFAMEQAAL
jgi:hypothetical protein